MLWALGEYPGLQGIRSAFLPLPQLQFHLNDDQYRSQLGNSSVVIPARWMILTMSTMLLESTLNPSESGSNRHSHELRINR